MVHNWSWEDRDGLRLIEAYCAAREQNLIIAGDCTDAGDSCFCTMMGHLPHPEGGYDLLLCPIEGGYVVETGSEKGERLVDRHGALFEEALPSHVQPSGSWPKTRNP